MFGSVLLLMAMTGPMVLLATILHFLFPDKSVNKLHQWIPPAITAISVWSLCTCWLWFYLFNLYVTLPAFSLAVVLHMYAIRKRLNPKLKRVNSALLIATLIMGFISFVYFDI